jgi:hypothetical protein
MIERPLAEALGDDTRARELANLLRECRVENEGERKLDLTELVM